MMIAAALIGILGTYLIIGFALSVLIYAGLHKEWRFFIRYDSDEIRLTSTEIKTVSDLTFWFWPIVLILMVYSNLKDVRNSLGNKLSGKS